MELKARELVKTFIAQRAITIKKLAELLTEKTGKKYTQGSLSQKLNRGTISYNEVSLIAGILNYRLSYEDIT
ncbi:hypothetical protein J6G99_00085 [bacterium]|nr:hypothetical protein [bacterium]